MDDFQEKLLRRLDLLIRLQLENGPRENTTSSVTSVVHRLLDFGLAPAEVSSIVGKPLNYITALASSKRAKGLKGKRNKR